MWGDLGGVGRCLLGCGGVVDIECWLICMNESMNESIGRDIMRI